MNRDLGRLAVLLALAALVRLACPWPLGTLWGVSESAVLVALCAPIWVAAAVRSGVRATLQAAVAGALFLAGVFTLDALPDRSHYGVAGHATALFFTLTVIAWVGGGDFRRFGLGLDLRDRATRRALILIPAILGGLFLVFLGLLLLRLVPPHAAGQPAASLRETLVFQFLVVALDEELAWRGFFQTYLDGALAGRVRILGAELGWGALLSAVLFALLHMVKVSLGPWHVGFAFQPWHVSAFLYVYLRAVTRSIWPCVILHGLWDGLGNSLAHIGAALGR